VPPPPQTPDLGADSDQDGVTNAYDVDDDNDGVLDVSDPDEGNPNNFPGRVFTNLWADLPDTLNADLGPGAFTDASIDKDLTAAFTASPWQVLAGRSLTAVDVNCFAISWCAPGTGTAVLPDFAYGPQGAGPGQPATGSRFAAFDPNGDGLPNLSPDAPMIQQPAFGAMVLPGTGRAGLDPSATVDFRFTTDRDQFEYATTLGPSFVTTPAITSLSGHTISYPAGPDDPGVGGGHEIELTSPQVTFTIYRPQRPAIAGAEAPGYYDMGHLRYEVSNPFNDTGAALPRDHVLEPEPDAHRDVERPRPGGHRQRRGPAREPGQHAELHDRPRAVHRPVAGRAGGPARRRRPHAARRERRHQALGALRRLTSRLSHARPRGLGASTKEASSPSGT
jgi:hypothetical protein